MQILLLEDDGKTRQFLCRAPIEAGYSHGLFIVDLPSARVQVHAGQL